MAQAKTQPKLTFEEFLEYDDGTDKRYELVDGVPVEVPEEKYRNVKLARQLAKLLEAVIDYQLIHTHATAVEVTPTDDISQESRRPDLMVLTPELDILLEDEPSAIALSMPNPPLVVEFVSPYDRTSDENYQRDYAAKRKQYEQRQIPEYWIVDATAQKVTVLMLKGRKYAEQVFAGQDKILSAAFPALELTAEQIFASNR